MAHENTAHHTKFLDRPGGRIAYDVSGSGPLVVLSHGMAESRTAFRYLAPLLVSAGYRVATVDLRGQGESDVGFGRYTRSETAKDLLALIGHLGGPAVIVGHSYSGGAATIAAATDPKLVAGIAELGTFTRAQSISIAGMFRNAHYRRGWTLLIGAGLFGSVGLWARYLNRAYPGVKPRDWDRQIAEMRVNLREPGRMKALQAMGRSVPKDAGAALPHVRCPALIIMGTLDPDWADPKAEADGIAGEMPTGIARVVMVDGAGHYAHVQYPNHVAEILVPFLRAATA